ncbi:MAG: flotillin family protein [Planctomycetota bacterium]|jgi:flotillin
MNAMHLTQAATPWEPMIFIGLPSLIILSLMIFLIKRYRRCPSNRVLVVYGKVGGNRAAKCIHGGGVMVWPVIQDYVYMSLEPMTIEIDLTSALSKQNIRVNVPSTFTIGISTRPDIMQNAAERLLGLGERDIASQARDIILGQLRLVIATLTIEEINQDREKFLELVTKNVGYELNKIGLEVINVNIRDITDESAYIEAIGKKAAAEAINRAKIEVADALKRGSIGEATAVREREIEVANQMASSQAGQKKAEREQRVQVAGFEAESVKGENESKAHIADYEATLSERRAEAKRRGEVALANAARDVLIAEREREKAKLEKEQIVQQQIEREKIEIEAEAEAERIRRIAKGEADGILLKYKAEAEGVQAVLEAKAAGYENLIRACAEDKRLAPTLLMVEKMPELVREQVKAIQNLQIDKITVWDSGHNGEDARSTAGFLKSLIGSLPPMHDLAEQAGVELPGILGSVTSDGAGHDGKPRVKPAPPKQKAPVQEE